MGDKTSTNLRPTGLPPESAVSPLPKERKKAPKSTKGTSHTPEHTASPRKPRSLAQIAASTRNFEKMVAARRS